MTLTRILLLINPHSGTHQRDELIAAANDWKENTSLCDIDIVEAVSMEASIAAVKKAIDEKYYAVVIMGGDGTANTIGAMLCGSDTALGIIPTGSGNGIARHMGMSMTVKKALEQIIMSRIHTVDTMMVNGHFCMGVAGTGFEAVVADSFAQRQKRGLMTYSAVAITEFMKYHSVPLEIEIDGKTISRTPFTLSFANSSQWGNDFKIAPRAGMTTGTIKVVILSDIDQITAMPCVAALLSGNIQTMPQCETLEAKHIHIEKKGIMYHIDGEYMGECDTLDVEIRPSSLRVLSPLKRLK